MPAELPVNPAQNDRLIALARMAHWHDVTPAQFREALDHALTTLNAEEIGSVADYLTEIHNALEER